MLYVSTRNSSETYTAHVALTRKKAADGGCFVPFKIPSYSEQDIKDLKEKPFNQILAEILNQFFSSRLTPWDVDLVIGRSNIKTLAMNHRLMVAELWHNPAGDFSYLYERLHGRLVQSADSEITPWFKTAVRIATCFAVYGQLLSEQILQEGAQFDVAVPADDVMCPVAVCYARKMGLPINTIICSCSSEENMWDLVKRGMISTSALTDDACTGIEALVYVVLGGLASVTFADACTNRKPYNVGEILLPDFTKGLDCTVAGEKRTLSTINSFFRSNRYIIDPYAAICYSGIQDFRSSTGSSRMTLLFSEHTPRDFSKQISEATGIPESKLQEFVKI